MTAPQKLSARPGYEYLGEFGIAGRRYLRKGGDERTHQLHIFAAEDKRNILRHIAVRDYLRRHKEAREEYAALKNGWRNCTLMILKVTATARMLL